MRRFLLLVLLALAGIPTRRPAAQDALPPVVAQARPDSGVSFHALVTPGRVYVGQQAMYQIAVFVSDQLRGKLRRNPEYIPPELRGLLAYDVRNGYRLIDEHVVDGVRYEVHLFQRAVFPLTAGSVVIPPARLSYAVPLGPSFFSREESRTLRSAPVTLEVIEPPSEGRPGDWRGAVGRFAVSAAVDAREPRVGDPLKVTVRVSGEGNVSLLPRPRLAVPWGTVVTADERVRLDSAAAVVSGTKEFDWIVTPTRIGDASIEPLRYPFWNPATEAWEVAVTRPESLRVRAGGLAASEAADAERARLLPLRAAYRGALPTPLSSREPFWLLLLAVPLPALAVGMLGRRRPRAAAASVSPRRRLDALARARSDDAAVIRRAFLGALAERLGISTATLTSGESLRRAMRRAGVADATARETTAFVAALDAAAYAGGEAPRSADARAAAALFARVSEEARAMPATAPRRLSALFLAAAVGAAAASLAAATRDVERFREGLRMYDRGGFGDAVHAFADVAREVPRAADAWANLGTAAWLAGDTAAAAVGWQRALRLEPRAADVRLRLDLLPAGHDGAIAGVPVVPADWILVPAAIAWVALWGAIAWAMRRPRDRRAVAFAVVAAVGAATLGTAGERVSRRLEARDLVVLREDLALRSVPALRGEESASAVVGDVARVARREGRWLRVELDGKRDGWVEADRVVEIGR